MNELSPRTVKWLTKMINHKRWRRYAYARVKKDVWRVMYRKGFRHWEYMDNLDNSCLNICDFKSEQACVKAIATGRFRKMEEVFNNHKDKKRKWTYLP